MKIIRAMYMSGVTDKSDLCQYGRVVYLVEADSGPKGVVEAERKLAAFLGKDIDWVHLRFVARSTQPI